MGEITENYELLSFNYLKILMNFMQTFCIFNFFTNVNNQNTSADLMINQIFEAISGYFSSISNLNCLLQGILNILSKYLYSFKDENGYYYKVMISCIIPFIFAIMFVCIAILKKTENAIKTLVTVLILSVYTFQPNIVRSLFNVYNCQQIDNNYFIQNEMKIECYTEQYNKWLFYFIIPCSLLFCLILPGWSIFYLLRMINSDQKEKALKNYGFLLQSFGYAKFYWYNIIKITFI